MTRLEHRARQLEQIQPDLLRLARHLARDRVVAEDVVQETLLNVWSQISQGHEIHNLPAYLKTTMRRNLSKMRRKSEIPSDHLPEQGHRPEADARLACADVMRAIEELPSSQADLILMLAKTEQSYEQLSATLGMPVGTVTSRLSRARATLRRRFDLPQNQPVDALI